MSIIIQVHINKTGGTSLREAIPGLAYQPRHLNARELKGEYGNGWDDAYVFTFVRSPFPRVVSMYEYQRQKYRIDDTEPGVIPPSVGFDAWVKICFKDRIENELFHEARYYQPCTWWIDDDCGCPLVDHVYRFEEYDKGLDAIRQEMIRRKMAGFTFHMFDEDMPHLKKTEYFHHWSEYYENTETRDTVTRFFEKDLERFEYGL